MSREAPTPAVFDEPEFWYRVDVDYEEAAERVESEDDGDESGQNGGPESIEEALLDAFVKRKRPVILDHFESIEAFRERVTTDDSARSILDEIYVQHLWRLNQEGAKFDSEADGLDAIEAVADDETLVQESVNDEYDLLWPGEATIGKEVADGDLVARRYYETKPVVIKKSNGSFEVRGQPGNRKEVVSSFRSDDDLEEQEPELAEEPIVGKVRRLLVEDNDEFRVVGVDFAESELPQNSRLRIKNERPVYEDIEALRDENLVSFEGISEVKKLYLKDARRGGKFRVELKHGVEGVEFNLKANHKLDKHRERFKEGSC